MRLSPPLPKETALPFSWSYLTLNGELLLFAGNQETFGQWRKAQSVFLGVSLPGALNAERLRQAARALADRPLDSQSRTAFYSEAMTNDQMLKQNNPVLWAVNLIQSNPGSRCSFGSCAAFCI